MALEVSSAAVETLAAANWMAYNRQAEIVAVVRVVVKAVVLSAVVAAVVTVAEVKDKMVIGRAGELGMTAITCVLGGRTVMITIVLIVVIIFVVMLEVVGVVIF